ncbi:unknown [Clostridium sp. CAG:448]|nr:unknown [Clostridium sp. CAG:448]
MAPRRPYRTRPAAPVRVPASRTPVCRPRPPGSPRADFPRRQCRSCPRPDGRPARYRQTEGRAQEKAASSATVFSWIFPRFFHTFRHICRHICQAYLPGMLAGIFARLSRVTQYRQRLRQGVFGVLHLACRQGASDHVRDVRRDPFPRMSAVIRSPGRSTGMPGG